MKKPQNYNDVKKAIEMSPLTLGAHSCVIKQCTERGTKNGGAMFVAQLDCDKDDKNPDYFSSIAKARQNSWPYQGTAYVYSQDAYGNGTDFLVKFVEAVESSNGCQVEWGDAMASSLVGKRIGVVYGECEFVDPKTGAIRIAVQIVDYCDVNAVADIPVPKRKCLSKSLGTSAGNGQKIPKEQVKELLNC